jgi:DNA repair exonuclease SbcCD ATPase subunit
MNYLLKALVKKLEGEIAVAQANVEVYLKSSVGIGEHPDIVEAIETQVTKIAEAEEKIDTIYKHFPGDG